MLCTVSVNFLHKRRNPQCWEMCLAVRFGIKEKTVADMIFCQVTRAFQLKLAKIKGNFIKERRKKLTRNLCCAIGNKSLIYSVIKECFWSWPHILFLPDGFDFNSFLINYLDNFDCCFRRLYYYCLWEYIVGILVNYVG